MKNEIRFLKTREICFRTGLFVGAVLLSFVFLKT